MLKTITIIIFLIASAYIGLWVSKNLQVHYFLEEYYDVLNLDPQNEKDTEGLRQNIQSLMAKTIPEKYQPESDHFQCFKIISEAVFFCNADTYRKNTAELLQNFFTKTIPQEIGRVSEEFADDRLASIKQELESNRNLLSEKTKALEKIKTQVKKNSAEEKKFQKLNDLYKHNQELYKEKLDLLQSMYGKTAAPDVRDEYKERIDDVIVDMKAFEDEYEGFREKNRQFSHATDERDTLQTQIDDIKSTIKKNQVDIAKLERVVSSPNEVGKVANTDTFQLSVDPNRHKFDTQYRPINAIWFSIVTFLLLSNLLYLFPKRPKPAVQQEDQTMIEGQLYK